MHIPEPRLHAIRDDRASSSVVRTRQRRAQAATGAGPPRVESAGAVDPDLRALRYRRAELIRWIHEVDPVACPRCGGEMRVIALITDPKVIHTIPSHLAIKGTDGHSSPEAPQSHRPAA